MDIIQHKWRKILLFGIVSLAFFGCKKEDGNFDDPYAGGREPLGIHLSTDPPSIESGSVGDQVTFKATGLTPYKDSIHFYLNNEEATITKVDSASVSVKVPANASTGVSSLIIGDEIYFGPVFRVKGNLGIDPNFKATVGANGGIYDFLRLRDERMMLVGGFSDFNHKGAVKPINRIVLVSKDGEVDRSLKSGKAVDGYLNAIAQLPDGRIVIGGAFSSYDTHRGEISNITVLNKDGSLDSIVVRTATDQDTVPAFNGGTDGTITRTFIHNNQITAVGGFNYYLQHIYDRSTKYSGRDSLIVDSVRVRNIVRLFPDGSLDSSFNYNFYTHQSKQGPNGPIFDAFMQDDGKLIIVGNFSQYNGENVNNIVRLNEDGTIDRSFKVGNGTDAPINSIRYNAVTKRYVITGNFAQFAGEVHNGLVLINTDGSVDAAFKPAPRETTDFYTNAMQLSNGMVLVNGFFQRYAGIYRGNFMVLDATGKLATGYNNTGTLQGMFSRGFEAKNSSGQITVTMIGSFYKFDEQSMGSIVRLVFK